LGEDLSIKIDCIKKPQMTAATSFAVFIFFVAPARWAGATGRRFLPLFPSDSLGLVGAQRPPDQGENLAI